MRGDFILILEQPSLFFYDQKQVSSYWLYFDISDALFAIMVKPRTLPMSFKTVQNLIINQRIIVFGIH